MSADAFQKMQFAFVRQPHNLARRRRQHHYAAAYNEREQQSADALERKSVANLLKHIVQGSISFYRLVKMVDSVHFDYSPFVFLSSVP